MVRFQAALAEQLFDIAERERVPKVPAHSTKNQLGLGLSPLEDRRSDCLLHDLFRLPAAAGQSCNTTAGRARAARKSTRASSASVETAGRTVPRARTPESRRFAGIDQRSQGRRGTFGRARCVPGVGRVGPPRHRVCHDRGPARTRGPGCNPRRTAGRCPATRRHPPVRGRELLPGGRPYAVVRRTRRRAGAVRVAAAPVGCARPRGVACACCAR